MPGRILAVVPLSKSQMGSLVARGALVYLNAMRRPSPADELFQCVLG